jgi:hypothetical protein
MLNLISPFSPTKTTAKFPSMRSITAFISIPHGG